MAVKTILFDRVISVALYRPPYRAEPTYVAGLNLGFSKNLNEPPSCVEFYPQNIREVFLGYRTTEDGAQYARFRRIRPTGKCITLDTLEQLKQGYTPSGVPYITGNTVRVKEDGSRWNVFVRNGTEASSMEGEIIERTSDSLVIASTDHGLKPDMALTINLLPGQNCYGAVLKIRNFNLDSINIRSWTRMVITAGYRTGATVQYTCPIFTSYTEQPNPDGITVFEGITVGKADSILSTQEIQLQFIKSKITLAQLVDSVVPAISGSLETTVTISKEIMNMEITIPNQTVYAQNGMAVLSWLQTTLTKCIEEGYKNPETGERVSAFVQLTGNKLLICALNGPNELPDSVTEHIINLDMVSSAVYNGTALTVEAPWNPDLQPGGLFYMPPQFINGSRLPNALRVEDYRNEKNMYRALTISLAFATVENTNKMTILAIPAQYAGQLPSEMNTEMRGDLFARSISRTIQHQMKTYPIPASGVEEGVNNVYEAPEVEKQMFDKGRGLIGIWGDWDRLTLDPTGNNCISLILKYYFYTYPNGPKLIQGSKGVDDKADSYWKDITEFRDNAYAQTYFQNTGCWSNPVWWPLVVVGTYWKKYADGPNSNWSGINILNPNLVEANRDVYVPIFSGTWTSMEAKLRAVRDIWKFAYIEYKALYPEMCKVWRAMYYYMGGEHVDELD